MSIDRLDGLDQLLGIGTLGGEGQRAGSPVPHALPVEFVDCRGLKRRADASTSTRVATSSLAATSTAAAVTATPTATSTAFSVWVVVWVSGLTVRKHDGANEGEEVG